MELNYTEAYVGLGGNIGDVSLILSQALQKMLAHPHIFDLKASRFYRTTPVSDLPQDSYINAVCSFNTTLTAPLLLKELQQIETALGKTYKPKNHPRKIDLDLLFFGKETIKTDTLEVPHPRWQERLFVLTPLADLTDEIEFLENEQIIKKNIRFLLKNFLNINNEAVTLL